MKKILTLFMTLICVLTLGLASVYAAPGSTTEVDPPSATSVGNLSQGGSQYPNWHGATNYSGEWSSFTYPKSQALKAPKGYADSLKISDKTQAYIFIGNSREKVSTADSMYGPTNKYSNDSRWLTRDEAFNRLDKSTGNLSPRENFNSRIAVDPSKVDTPFGYDLTNCTLWQVMDIENNLVAKESVDVRYTVTNVTPFSANEDALYEYYDGLPNGYDFTNAKMVALRLTAHPTLNILGIKDATIKVEFFEPGTNFTQKKDIWSFLTYADIDAGQKITIYDAQSWAPQAVAKNTNLDMTENSNGSLTFGQPKEYFEEHANNEVDSIGLWFSGDKYTVKYHQGGWIADYTAEEYGIHPGSFIPSWNSFFGGSSQQPMMIPYPFGPNKAVADSDESWTTPEGEEYGITYDNQFNTLNEGQSTFTYDIEQLTTPIKDVPNWYYDNFVIEDTLIPGLTIEDVTVYNRGEDVSSWFTVQVDNNDRHLVVTAKNSAIKNADFYDTIFRVRVKVKIDPKVLSNVSDNYNESTYKAGLFTSNDGTFSPEDWGTVDTYKIKNWKKGNQYVVIPNKASSTIDDFGKQWSAQTYTFVPIPEPEPPQKSVKDADEAFGDAWDNQFNTLSNEEKSVYFNILQEIPNWYYKNFSITDTVSEGLEVEDVKVYRSSEDVSDMFTITVNGRKVTLTAKDACLEEMAGKRYHVRIKANIQREALQFVNTKYNESTYAPGTHEGKTFGNYTIKNWVEKKFYVAVPNKASAVVGTFSNDSKVTKTFIEIPKPEKVAPVKRVSDSDNKTLTGTGEEKKVLENTIEKPTDVYTYHVYNRLNGGYAPHWHFKTYEITDTLEDLLVHTGTPKVYEHTVTIPDNVVKYWESAATGANNPAWVDSLGAGTDVTSKFDISVSGKTISAKAKSSALSNQNFYNTSNARVVKIYELRFDAKIDTDTYKNESDLERWKSAPLVVTWKNNATLKITDTAGPDDNGSYTGKSNDVKTNVQLPNGDLNEPSIKVTKTTDPYEFRVNEDIPYTITLQNMNKDAVAYKIQAEDTSLPDGFIVSDIKVTGGENSKATISGEHDITITADYLRFGDTITVTFTGKATKPLNGKVIPNTVYARAWGTAEDDKNTWDTASTSVYINSPKIKVEKTMDKKPDADGKIRVKSGDPIQFNAVITNENPGTFMRNVYAVDTSATKGLLFDPSSLTVKYNSKTDTDRLVTLKEGRDYVIETYKAGEAIPLDNIGGFVGSVPTEDYVVPTASKEENAGKADGQVLPTANEGGFYIRFIGNYRNLGFMDKTIPATSDPRGQNAKYLADALKAVDAEQGVNSATDYENLNLQNKFVLTYNMIVQEEDLGSLDNFIRVPATENTNNDLIDDDDDIPSGGGHDSTGEEIEADPPVILHNKTVKETITSEGQTLHYTLKSNNSSGEKATGVVITDRITSGNAVMNKDAVVKLNGTDITETCEIAYEDESFTITLNRDFNEGEELTVNYTATVRGLALNEDKTLVEGQTVDNESVLTANRIDPITAKTTVPVDPTPMDKGTGAITTFEGARLPYTLRFKNETAEVWESVKVIDTITTGNARYNDDFVVTMNGEEINAKVTIDESTATIETGRDMQEGDELIIKYSATATDGNRVENEAYTIDRNGRIAHSPKVLIVPVTHEKDVAEEQHDGPDGQINTLHYTLTSQNKDSLPIHNVVITDEVLTKNLAYNKDIKITFGGEDITESCNIKYEDNSFVIETGRSLEPGQEIITTYSAKVTNRKLVHNETVLTADGIDGIHDDEVVTSPEDGVYVTTRKSSEPPSGSFVKEGDEITYTLEATNTGDVESFATRIRDYIPEGTSFVSVQDDGVYVEDKNFVEWVIGSIKPGESKAVTFVVRVNENPPKEIWNVALYENITPPETPENPEDPENPDTPDKPEPPKPGENPEDPDLETEETVHYTDPEHDPHTLLRAKKSCEPVSGSEVTNGTEIKYFIDLENYGDKDTETAGVRDYIPANTELVSVEEPGVYNEAKNCVDWTNLKLKAGETVRLTFTVKVTGKVGNKVENQAMYQNDWTDPEKDPSSTTNIVVHPIVDPVLEIEKIVDKKKVPKGETVTFTIKAVTKGTINPVVTDQMPDGFELDEKSIVVPEGAKYKVENGLLTVNILDGTSIIKYSGKVNKDIKNIAVLDADNNPGDPVKDDEDVEVVKPELQIKKTSDKTQVGRGEKVKFTIVASAKNAVNPTVTDKMPDGFKLDKNSITVSEGCTYKLKGDTLVVNVINGDSVITFSGTAEKDITNVAIIDSDNNPDGPKQSEAKVKVKDPILKIVKTVDKKEVAKGETVKFTIQAHAENAIDPVVTDKMPSGFEIDKNSIKVSNGCKYELKGNTLVVKVINGDSTITYSGKVNKDIDNIATLDSSNNPNGPVKDNETVKITVPKLEIEKTVNKGTVSSGETVTFTIVATAENAVNPLVTDKMPSGFELDESSIKTTKDCQFRVKNGVLEVKIPNGKSTITYSGKVNRDITNVAVLDSDNNPDGPKKDDARVNVPRGSSPKTGDSTPLYMMIAILLAAFSATTGMIWRRKKQ